jgi:hypothetical protein
MIIIVSRAGPPGHGAPGARAATQKKGTVMLKSLAQGPDLRRTEKTLHPVTPGKPEKKAA